MWDNQTAMLYYPCHVFSASSTHNDHGAIKCLEHLLTRANTLLLLIFFGYYCVRVCGLLRNFLHETCKTLMLLRFSKPDIIDGDDDDDVNNGSNIEMEYERTFIENNLFILCFAGTRCNADADDDVPCRF